jgi:hypothetical protein
MSSFITPNQIGKFAYLLAQDAGWKPTRCIVRESWNAKVVYVKLANDEASFVCPFTEADRQKSADELEAIMVERWPQVFKPKTDPKAEMKKKINQTFLDAIESLDKLRNSLTILKEATDD